MNIMALLMIGLFGGVIGGLFGVGGGVIVVPALVFFLGFSQHMAQGTMLFTFFVPSFALAVWTYYKAGNVDIPSALLVALGMFIGAFLGARFAQQLPVDLLKKLFGVLVVIVGLKLIFWK